MNDTSKDDIEKSDIIPSINSDHSAIRPLFLEILMPVLPTMTILSNW